MSQGPTQQGSSGSTQDDTTTTTRTTGMVNTALPKKPKSEMLFTTKEMRTQMTKMEPAELVDPETSGTQELSESISLQGTQFDDPNKDSKLAGAYDRKKGTRQVAKKGSGETQNSKECVEEDDDDEGDSYSEDIMVVQNEEDQDYLNKVIIGKLSRLGLRDTLWSTKAQSFFVIFSFLISYQSFISFLVEFDKYGGIFIIPYVVATLLIAVPAMYVETALGQYTSSSVCVLFDRMTPAFTGLGFACLAYNFLTIASDEMILNHFSRYLLKSGNVFGDQLPYHHCSNSINTIECRSVMHPSCEDLNRQIAKLSSLDPYYRDATGLRYVAYGDLCIQSRLSPVQNQKGVQPFKIEKMEFPEWMTALAANQIAFWNFDMETMRYIELPTMGQLSNQLFASLLVYLVCANSQKIVVKVQKISIHLAFSAFLTLLVAILIFKPPNFPHMSSLSFDKGLSLEAWIRATILVIRMFKLGQGGFIYMGAQHDIHNPILPDCLMIAAVLTVVPTLYTILHLLITDSFLLEMLRGDMMKAQAVGDAIFEHPLFTSHSQILNFSIFSLCLGSLGSYEGFIITIFSMCGILIVLSNKIAHTEIIVSSIREFAFEPEDHKLVLATVIITSSLGTMIFRGGDGFLHHVSTDNFLLPALAIVIMVFQVIALFSYGPIRFFANLMFISNRRNMKDKRRRLKQYINAVIIILFLIGIPFVAILQLLAAFIPGMTVWDDTQPFTTLLFIVLAGIIPFVAWYKMSDQFYRSGDFFGLFSPNRDLWGPRSSADRDVAELVERETRLQGVGDTMKIFNKSKT